MKDATDLLLSRRTLVGASGLGLAAATMGGGAVLAQAAGSTGSAPPSWPKVTLPGWTADTERSSPGPENPAPVDERVGYAVIGLGRLSLEEILPAFAQSKLSSLRALVSGAPEKARAVAAQYGVDPSRVYSYQDFEKLRDAADVQIVYIVLPNSMHAEYVKRAAAIGKHVLCEKPMATNAADCRDMIAACKQANVRLMIAYRCQYEPYNRELVRLVRSGAIGPLKYIDAINTQNMGHPEQWRLKKALAGGGAMPDVGIYCLNATRYITGEEPVEIFARQYSTPDDPRFREVEETVSFSLRFPSGVIANCLTSYGMHETRRCRVQGPKGWIDLDPAFAYGGLEMRVGHADGATEISERRKLAEKQQFALELDHMALCVRNGRVPRTPGEEGLQDQILMDAIYKSAAEGMPVRLPEIPGRDTTRGPEPEPV